MMKPKCLLGAVLIVGILFFISDQSYGQQYSPQFNSLLNQIQQTYLAPKGETLSSFRDKYPTIVATLIGHALRQQMVFVQQNPSLKNQFTNLQREAQAYITEVARTTPARASDGMPYSAEGLWSLVSNALQGTEDGWVSQSFGVRTGTMSSVMAASGGPQRQTSDRPAGAPPSTKEEKRVETKKGISLLGEEAPGVTVDKSGKLEVIYPPRSANVSSPQQPPSPPKEVLPQAGLGQIGPRTGGFYRNRSWNDFFYYLRFFENGMVVRVAAGDHLAGDAGRASVTGQRLTADMYDRDGLMLLMNPGRRNAFGQSRDQQYKLTGGTIVLDLKGLTYRGEVLELTSGADARNLTGVVQIWGKRYDVQLDFIPYTWSR